MSDFTSKRTVKKHVQKLNASPDRVFPLLCPAREYEWIQPWKCEMVFSRSGYAEDNCVFRTNFPQDLEPETWIVSRYVENREIQFIRFNKSLVIRHNITLTDNQNGTTDAEVEQIFSGLDDRGNEFIESFDDEAFVEEEATLEKMLNHYLETGRMLKVFEESETP